MNRAKQARPLAGRVALVAGGTRGAGRGIAEMLGEAGAVVYVTGRSSRKRKRPAARAPRGSKPAPFRLAARPETIEETAERVTARGGQGVAVRVDHTDEPSVAALLARIRTERGRLDVLINDVWGGEELIEWGVPFWKIDAGKTRTLLERAVYTHVLTARHAVPLMLETGAGGLIVEMTDGLSHAYRSQLAYDLVKSTVIRLAFGMSEELRVHRLTAVAVSPGFLRSEAMLDYFGVTEPTWRDGAAKDRHFAKSETPRYVGRGIAALAADPARFALTGRFLSSADLAERYGCRDDDGSRPDFPRYFRTARDGELAAMRTESAASRARFVEMFGLPQPARPSRRRPRAR